MCKIKNQKNKEINIEKENEKKSENNFFDFDMETNVFDKFSERNNYLTKKRNKPETSLWNYEKILNNEKEIKNIKENKRKRDLKINNIELNNNKLENKNLEDEKSIEEAEENIYMLDKFENAVYAKGISFLNIIL